MNDDFITSQIENLFFIGAMTASIAASLMFAWLFNSALKHYSKKKDRHLSRTLHKHLRMPVYILLPIIGLYIALAFFYPLVLGSVYLSATFKVMFVFTVIWLVLRLVKIITLLIKRRFDITNEDNLRARAVYTQITVIQRVVSFVIIVLGLASFFLLFEELHTIGVSLMASAGVAGIVLGLAAQKTLGNLLAGIQIAIAQPIRIDDAVVVEGEWGWIEEITLTYVVVRIWDLRRLVLPISYFIEKPFQNWTRNSANILGSVHLYTDYTMPIEPIREKLAEILEDNPKWNGNAQVVQVTECKPDTMEIRILVSGKNSPITWELRCEVREKLIAFIQENYPPALPKTRAVFMNEENKEISEIKAHQIKT